MSVKSDRQWTRELSLFEPKTDRQGNFKPTTVYLGQGLNLKINVSRDKKKYSKSWILRYTIHGRPGRCGLGAFPDVAIGEARERAESARQLIKEGKDPVVEKQRERQDNERIISFQKAAIQCHEDIKDSFRSEQYRKEWLASLKRYAFPKIGKIPVREINESDVLRVLRPIWKTRTRTASMIRGRIAKVIGWSVVNRYREKGLNPAIWADNIEHSLPAPSTVHKTKNHPALRFDEVNKTIMEIYKKRRSMVAMAVIFAFLTVVRSKSVRLVTWEQINFSKGVWSIPEENTKTDEFFQVPLSSYALALLEEIKPYRHKPSDFIFFSKRNGGEPLASTSMSNFFRRYVHDEVTIHGSSRSTFRDWLGELTDYPEELGEFSLAHKKGGVEGAYRRMEAVRKRAPVMEDWGKFIHTEWTENVVVFDRNKKRA
jgi:integrase